MEILTLRWYAHFCAACVLCRISKSANTLTIEGGILARKPASPAESSTFRTRHPSSPIAITCCLPPSPSPRALQHGYSLQRVTLMTSQDDVMPDLLADADPAVSDVARNVSGLSDVTVSGNVSEGCLVLVLRRGECQDSGEYMCVSDYGTTTKVLDMYPGEVAIAAENDGPLKHRREVQCSVLATVEITWSWRSRHSADSPWTYITTDNDHNVSEVIPDVMDRCDVAWTSVLSVSQGTSDKSMSFQCCAGYRNVSNVSCTTWSPAGMQESSPILPTEEDVSTGTIVAYTTTDDHKTVSTNPGVPIPATELTATAFSSNQSVILIMGRVIGFVLLVLTVLAIFVGVLFWKRGRSRRLPPPPPAPHNLRRAVADAVMFHAQAEGQADHEGPYQGGAPSSDSSQPEDYLNPVDPACEGVATIKEEDSSSSSSSEDVMDAEERITF